MPTETRPARKPTKADLEAARGKGLPDLIAPDLTVLFCGINPGLYTAATGHHFARPGNRFWPALHDGGFTPRLLAPHEEKELLPLGCGITNLVNRATARADELSTDELVAGARRLRSKVHRFGPRFVAFVGITAFRAAFGYPDAKLGRHDERLAEATVWLLPSTSGLNAHYQKRDFGRLFAKLRRAARRPG